MLNPFLLTNRQSQMKYCLIFLVVMKNIILLLYVFQVRRNRRPSLQQANPLKIVCGPILCRGRPAVQGTQYVYIKRNRYIIYMNLRYFHFPAVASSNLRIFTCHLFHFEFLYSASLSIRARFLGSNFYTSCAIHATAKLEYLCLGMCCSCSPGNSDDEKIVWEFSTIFMRQI